MNDGVDEFLKLLYILYIIYYNSLVVMVLVVVHSLVLILQ